MKFYCVGDDDTVRGFRLAGIEGQVTTNPAETAEAFQWACLQPGVGIIILTQESSCEISQDLHSFRMEHDVPLVVEVPGPKGPQPDWPSLQQLVHQALGMKIGDEPS